jgi:transcriptional regulator with XRE-family HTH domain
MDAALLVTLRKARGLSVEQLAERVQVHPDTIERWEASDTKIPYPINRRRLAQALNVPLGPLVVAVWGAEQGLPEAVIQANRRTLLQAVGLLPATLGACRLPAVDFHEQTITLVTRYATAPSDELLSEARAHLNTLVGALGEPMRSGQRRSLQVDAAETASLAAHLALACGYQGEAAAYFLLARSLADESQVAWLRGCTLAHSTNLHAPIIGDNDPLAALEMLAIAAPLVGTTGLAAKYVAMLQAEMLAGLKREREARRTIDRTFALPDGDDHEGFFSGRGFFIRYAKMGETRIAAFAGRDLILLGHGGEGLEQLTGALAGPIVDLGDWAILHADAALGHAVAGHDPEPACAEAHQALDAAKQAGVHKVTRVRHARNEMPGSWATTSWVQELDERLRLGT